MRDEIETLSSFKCFLDSEGSPHSLAISLHQVALSVMLSSSSLHANEFNSQSGNNGQLT